jgi:hypothetical protein
MAEATSNNTLCNFGKEDIGRFYCNLWAKLKGGYILTNPSFNISDWVGEWLPIETQTLSVSSVRTLGQIP